MCRPGQYVDMNPCKGHWDALGNGVRDVMEVTVSDSLLSLLLR